MIALFGAGCFWGVQEKFHRLSGVNDTRVGYAGGCTENPTYQQVCTGSTGHAEVCLVDFDEEIISYEALLEVFFNSHDATTLNRQGVDIGTQYRSVIYYANQRQKEQAVNKRKQLLEQGMKLVTEISPLPEFWSAEEYHQHYLSRTDKDKSLKKHWRFLYYD